MVGDLSIKSAAITTEYQSGIELNSQNLPCIQLIAKGESDQPGPMANMKTRYFKVLCRLIVWYPKPADAHLESNPQNIYKMTDRMRSLVAGSKQLTSDDFLYGLEVGQPATDGVFANPQIGFYNARDLELTYRRYEEWDGIFNEQSTLVA